MYKEFLIIFLIIIVHEMGHFLMAKYYKWNIDKIYIYPFGGCVKFNEDLNRPLKEELLIMISGPLSQIIFYILIVFLYRNDIVALKTYLLFKNYHYSMLIFNLLPFLPLDGGKLFNIICNYFFPYKKSFRISVFISYITFILAFIYILFYYRNINLLSMTIFLLSKVVIESKKIDILYNRLLLERYLKKYSFSKTKVIKNKDNMYKDYKHVIKNKNKYITEKEYLKERFRI